MSLSFTHLILSSPFPLFLSERSFPPTPLCESLTIRSCTSVPIVGTPIHPVSLLPSLGPHVRHHSPRIPSDLSIPAYVLLRLARPRRPLLRIGILGTFMPTLGASGSNVDPCPSLLLYDFSWSNSVVLLLPALQFCSPLGCTLPPTLLPNLFDSSSVSLSEP